jgi:xanthine dehydrogenase molybdopterin-binding subunit B
MKVTLLPTKNTAGCAVMSSKASGEPAIILGATPFFALKEAVRAAREDAAGGAPAGYFRMDAPATPERVQQLCNSKPASN